MKIRSVSVAVLLVCAVTILQAQKVSVASTLIDMGQVMFGVPCTAEYELRGEGSRPFLINDVKPDCGCTIVSYSREPLKKGMTTVIRVTYDARQLGHFSKRIEVFPKDMPPLVLTMQGIVVDEVIAFEGDYPFLLGSLRADQNNIEFDDVNHGDRVQQKIHIMNPTSSTVQPVVMHLPNYITAEVSPTNITPGHSGEVTLTLLSSLLDKFGLTQTSTYLGSKPGDKVSDDKEIPVTIILLPHFDQLSDSQRLETPKIHLSTTALALRSPNGRKKAHGIIDITNEGSSTLDIRSLQMFSSGLDVSLSNTHILPGEKAKLKVTANVSKLRSARSKPHLLMITNDPQHPKIVIDINVE